ARRWSSPRSRASGYALWRASVPFANHSFAASAPSAHAVAPTAATLAFLAVSELRSCPLTTPAHHRPPPSGASTALRSRTRAAPLRRRTRRAVRIGQSPEGPSVAAPYGVHLPVQTDSQADGRTTWWTPVLTSNPTTSRDVRGRR